MRILVTGGAGFIGSHVVDAYLAAGHEVIAVDNLTTGNRANLNPKARFEQLDIRDREAVRALIIKERPEIISHLAAQAAVTVSGANPAETFDVNVTGTLNLLIAAKGVKKFIFVSTGGALYGDLTSRPFTEADPAQPLSAYGLSKLLGEQLVTFYAREYGFSYTILRLANAYGPRQNPKGEAGICAIFSLLMKEGKQPTIFNKQATRDYVYVADIAAAGLLALAKGDNATMNIGTGKHTSNQEVFELMASQYSYTGAANYQPARAGEVAKTALDPALAKKLLGWEAVTDLRAGIKLLHDYQA